MKTMVIQWDNGILSLIAQIIFEPETLQGIFENDFSELSSYSKTQMNSMSLFSDELFMVVVCKSVELCSLLLSFFQVIKAWKKFQVQTLPGVLVDSSHMLQTVA